MPTVDDAYSDDEWVALLKFQSPSMPRNGVIPEVSGSVSASGATSIEK